MVLAKLIGSFTLYAPHCSLHLDKPQKNEIHFVKKYNCEVLHNVKSAMIISFNMLETFNCINSK